MGRTIPVSDDLHNKIKTKISEIQGKRKDGRVVKIKEVVNVILINNIDKIDEYFDEGVVK